MSGVLSQVEIESELAGSGWEVGSDAKLITLDGEEADFAAAWAFASRVAEAAESANHHPDILVHGWNRWRITLSTHSEGGVTQADIALARTISALRS